MWFNLPLLSKLTKENKRDLEPVILKHLSSYNMLYVGLFLERSSTVHCIHFWPPPVCNWLDLGAKVTTRYACKQGSDPVFLPVSVSGSGFQISLDPDFRFSGSGSGFSHRSRSKKDCRNGSESYFLKVMTKDRQKMKKATISY